MNSYKIIDKNENLMIKEYIEPNKEINFINANIETIYNNFYKRTIISSVDSEDIICPSLPFMIEKDKKSFNINDIKNQITKAFYFPEGSCVRVYFHNNNWHCSTNKKLDASKSNWLVKISFFGLFEKMLEEINLTFNSLTEKLNKNKCYMFFISSSIEHGTQMTIKNEKSKLFLIGSFEKNINELIFEKLDIKGIEYLPEFNNFENTLEKVNKNYENYYYSSIVFILKNKLWIKVYHDYYFYNFKQRNLASVIEDALAKAFFPFEGERNLKYFNNFFPEQTQNAIKNYKKHMENLVREYKIRYGKKFQSTKIDGFYHRIIQDTAEKNNRTLNLNDEQIYNYIIKFLQESKNPIFHKRMISQ